MTDKNIKNLISFSPYKYYFFNLLKVALLAIGTVLLFVILILLFPVLWFKPVIRYITNPLSDVLCKIVEL